MIESTFWQAEELHELDQGLWGVQGINYYHEYCYNVIKGAYYTISFNVKFRKFDCYCLTKMNLGLTEHD